VFRHPTWRLGVYLPLSRRHWNWLKTAMVSELQSGDPVETTFHSQRYVKYLRPSITACATKLIEKATGDGSISDEFAATVSGVMEAIRGGTMNMDPIDSIVYRAAIANWSADVAQGLSGDQLKAFGFALAANSFSPPKAGADGPTEAERDLAAGVQLANDP
jgi:hypothetical protein